MQALLLLLAAALQSNPPISTDRPGFVFPPSVLSRGRLQIETGFPTLTRVRDSGDEVRTLSFPVALRYGYGERIELRASLPTWTDVRDETGGSVALSDGFSDSEIGVRFALSEGHGDWGGPLAFQTSLRLPTGADDLSSDEIGVTALFLHGRGLGDSYWLQSMLGVTQVPVDGAEDQTAGAIGALVSRPIAGTWSAYVEATAFPGLNHTPGQGYVGAGLVHAPSSDMQLDLSADFGLDDDSADVIAAFGLSWRY